MQLFYFFNGLGRADLFPCVLNFYRSLFPILQIGDNLWVIGGANGSDQLRDGDSLRDVHMLNVRTFAWSSVDVAGECC